MSQTDKLIGGGGTEETEQYAQHKVQAPSQTVEAD